jgi:hypothetical protein
MNFPLLLRIMQVILLLPPWREGRRVRRVDMAMAMEMGMARGMDPAIFIWGRLILIVRLTSPLGDGRLTHELF